jgi:glycoprotein 6-alpha-L-fucosyltransferase
MPYFKDLGIQRRILGFKKALCQNFYFSDIESNVTVIQLPDVHTLIHSHSNDEKIAIGVPKFIYSRLTKLYDDPFAWWLGQFQKYYVNLRPNLKKKVSIIIKNTGFKKSMVVIHVRRAEKNREAAYVQIEKYMEFVNEYYEQLEVSKKPYKREILLLTDEPKVIREARQKYPNYTFLANESFAKIVHFVNNRYGEEYLRKVFPLVGEDCFS